MKRSETCALIREIGIVPAVRVSSAEEAHFAAEAVASGGIPIVEITLTVTGAVDLISHLAQYHPKMLVGAGTVLNTEMAAKCIDAGAGFLSGRHGRFHVRGVPGGADGGAVEEYEAAWWAEAESGSQASQR